MTSACVGSILQRERPQDRRRGVATCRGRAGTVAFDREWKLGDRRAGWQCGTDELMIPEITVEDLKRRMDSEGDLLLVDIREPLELNICRIEPSTLMRMNEIPARQAELDRDRDVVFYCRSGARSARVVAYLLSQGFTRVYNLKGGILAWIDRVDPSQVKY